ncbi:MAG TPA: hypothetical protein VFF69_04375 [Phycisphaerales bacterium]|nr:hypothetical protein [Phycisphaerales bacterium]
MRPRVRAGTALALLGAALVYGAPPALGQDAAGAAPAQPEAEADAAPLPAWIPARLEALSPDAPEAYFRLAEEVAAESTSGPEDGLARRLFGLAFELDRRDGSPTWIAPSSCLGLASLARLESDRRWLRALANSLDPSYALPSWRNPELQAGVSGAAFDAAEAIGAVRSGDGVRAADLLDRADVRHVIQRYGQLLGFSASSGALWQLDQWASNWPCRECGNERVIYRPNTDPPSYRECYTCRGNPGPRLSREQLVSQLRFEAHLLHGISRSWGAQLALDMGAPLREPSADELASVLGIDPARPYWRAGAWVASVDGGADAPTVGGGEEAPSPSPGEH